MPRPTRRAAPALLSFAVLALALLAMPAPATAEDAKLSRFFGAFVGSGTATRMDDKSTEKRDLDVTIKPFKKDGFTIAWITVMRGADGERGGDDVRRRAVEEDFLPYEDGRPGVYVLAPRGGLFQKSELPNPMKGEPMRWAAISGDTLTVSSMALTPEGDAELQIYHRTLTAKGMTVQFLRLENETVMLRLAGELTRTQP
ncbi:MAG: hypothetical protein AB7N54_08395 [Alphaproteobacteria bacterium]